MLNIPVVRVFSNADQLTDAAFQIFVESAHLSIRERGRFVTALAGGNTPRMLYEKLPQAVLEWNKMFFFWGDERCVPVSDEGNSYGLVFKAFLSKVGLPAKNILRVETELEPDEAARRYAESLTQFADPPYNWPRFDLTLLGLGNDGHTASLFPGSVVDPQEPVVAVTANYEERPARRVTLTPKVFNSSRKVLFMAAGRSKAVPLRGVLSDLNKMADLPAQRIRPIDGEVIWLVDQEAAGLLNIDSNHYQIRSS